MNLFMYSQLAQHPMIVYQVLLKHGTFPVLGKLSILSGHNLLNLSNVKERALSVKAGTSIN